MIENKKIPVKKNKEAKPRMVCPVCGEKVIQEKCKIVCKSEKCVYRIIYNCSEF
jgi:hypothetical protein